MNISPKVWIPILIIFTLIIIGCASLSNFQKPRVLGATAPIEKPVLIIDDGVENYYSSKRRKYI